MKVKCDVPQMEVVKLWALEVLLAGKNNCEKTAIANNKHLVINVCILKKARKIIIGCDITERE